MVISKGVQAIFWMNISVMFFCASAIFYHYGNLALSSLMMIFQLLLFDLIARNAVPAIMDKWEELDVSFQ